MKKIHLTQGKFALVDDADFEWLNQWKWCYTGDNLQGKGYAMRAIYLGGGQAAPKLQRIKMHRLILGLTDPKVFGDHVNGDTLDNQRSNIRASTNWQNGANRGPNKAKKSNPYKGVYKLANGKDHGKPWWALIVESSSGTKKRRSLGVYATPEEAASAYDRAAVQYFGEFAYLNNPAIGSQRK